VFQNIICEGLMPFTRSHYEEITALVKAGKVDQARRVVHRLNDPRAQTLLDRLLMLENRLDKVSDRGANPSQPKVKRNATPAPSIISYTLLITIILGACLIGAVWLAIQSSQSPPASVAPIAPTPYPTTDYNMRIGGKTTSAAIEMACEMVFTDLRPQIGSAAYGAGCKYEAARLISKSPGSADFCFEHYATTLTLFLECLTRKELTFVSANILKTPVPSVPVVYPTAPPIPTVYRIPTKALDTYPNNCAEAISMGMDEYEAGGYSHLDRDGDGVACYGD
jgi:hypothetical protein